MPQALAALGVGAGGAATGATAAAAAPVAAAGSGAAMSGLGAAGTGLAAAPAMSSVAPGIAGIAQGVAPTATQAALAPASAGFLGQISNFFDSYTGQPALANAAPAKAKPYVQAATNIAQKSGLTTDPGLKPEQPIQQPSYQPRQKKSAAAGQDPIVTEILARIFGNG